MLEAVVAPMTDSELSLPRPQAGRSFRRSITAHPAISGEKEQVSCMYRAWQAACIAAQGAHSRGTPASKALRLCHKATL